MKHFIYTNKKIKNPEHFRAIENVLRIDYRAIEDAIIDGVNMLFTLIDGTKFLVAKRVEIFNNFEHREICVDNQVFLVAKIK